MSRYLPICLILLLSGCLTQKNNIEVSKGLLIENVSVVSADENGAILNKLASVVIENGSIISISEKRPTLKGGFKTLDGTGKFLIPGLIDSHVHLNNIAGMNFRQRRTKPELVREYFDRLPKNFLYYGYTTLIDVDNYAPKTINKLRIFKIRPDIHTCAQKVRVMGDFEMVMDDFPEKERYQLPFLHDKYNPNVTYPDSINLKEHTPEVLVSDIAQNDNICVKVLYEDASSGLKQIWEMPSSAIIKDLVSEAHKNNLPVIMHAPSYEGQNFAYETGVDIIAHAMWNWTSVPEEYLSSDLPKTHEALLLKIAERQMGYQPTFRTLLAEIDILDDRFRFDDSLDDLYTKGFLNFLKSEDAEWIKQRILRRPKFLKRTNPEFFLPIRNQFESDQAMFDRVYQINTSKIQKVVKLLAENNANLLFGTDNGAMNMYTNPPGLNGYLEMQHWIDAGVSLEQLFKAVTFNNAKAFDLLDSVGTIEEGKMANLVVLGSNPLESIEAYDAIDSVILHGTVIPRSQLSAKH